MSLIFCFFAAGCSASDDIFIVCCCGSGLWVVGVSVVSRLLVTQKGSEDTLPSHVHSRFHFHMQAGALHWLHEARGTYLALTATAAN